MKKLLFATALLAALLLSACGGQKTDDDFMNKPAVTPEPGMEIDPEFGVDPETETDENAQPAEDAELSDMVDAIYKIRPVDLMGMETTAIDLTDESWYNYLAGLTTENVDKVDAAVISQPMTGSQAYSLILARVKDDADAQEIAASMRDNINLRRWVCVAADRARVVTFGDKVLFVMAGSELVDVDAMTDAAAQAFDVTFDSDESITSTEDDSDLPPEMLIDAPAVVG